MNLLNKIDLFINDEITTGDVTTNTAKGHVDVVGGKCPDGQIYDKIKKVCVPVKNESSVVGATYISGNSTIAGSGQTRIWGVKRGIMTDLARKEPVTDEKDDPAETNILGRKGLKFDKKSGAYVPSLWSEDE
jgi:hypothetical protein